MGAAWESAKDPAGPRHAAGTNTVTARRISSGVDGDEGDRIAAAFAAPDGSRRMQMPVRTETGGASLPVSAGSA